MSADSPPATSASDPSPDPAVTPADRPGVHPSAVENRGFLFWACFAALVTTAFGFIVRSIVIDNEWGPQFGFNDTQIGEIRGVGLWPFAISIILFSLVIDRIGYGLAMGFAFACHVVGTVVTIFGPRYGDPYTMLYVGTLIVALGNGAVEAVINPVVATIFADQKTKWLNILHAGWPGGLVIAGVLALLMADIAWEWRIALILLPTALYGVMMLFCRFPISERVAAGVSYRDMLRELGWGGALIVNFLILMEVGRVFGWPEWAKWVAIALSTGGFAAYVGGAFGRPLLFFLLLVMIPLASAELGTDTWIPALMEKPLVNALGIAGGWALVYTSFIMLVLRFFAGPIVHAFSPLGLLAGSAAVAIVGLVMLSQVEAALAIIGAATVYGFGKAFFWPTMLGVVAEQAPRGGALTLNATGGVGMLGVGVVGAQFLGYWVATGVENELEETRPAVHEQVAEEQSWLFSWATGDYEGINEEARKALPEDEQQAVAEIDLRVKQETLLNVAIFPAIMLAAYIGLIVYFKSRGGYRAVELTEGPATDAGAAEYGGGEPGPVK